MIKQGHKGFPDDTTCNIINHATLHTLTRRQSCTHKCNGTITSTTHYLEDLTLVSLPFNKITASFTL